MLKREVKLLKVPNTNENIFYPNSNLIIKINKEILIEYKKNKLGKPGDFHRCRDKILLKRIVEEIKYKNGDTIDKAVLLLKRLIQEHIFDSGNRRTAYYVVITFLVLNEVYILEDFDFQYYNSLNPNVMIGIREGFYTDKELKTWFETKNIKEFKRNKL